MIGAMMSQVELNEHVEGPKPAARELRSTIRSGYPSGLDVNSSPPEDTQ